MDILSDATKDETTCLCTTESKHYFEIMQLQRQNSTTFYTLTRGKVTTIRIEYSLV